MNFTDFDDNGVPYIVYNEKMIDAVSKLFDFISVHDEVLVGSTYGSIFADCRKFILQETLHRS